MKKYLPLFLLILPLTFTSVSAQVSSPQRVVYRSALPATCAPGSSAMVRLTVAPYSLNNCTAANTWTVVTTLDNTATGTGSLVRATSPTLVTPTLGAASATTLTTTGGGVDIKVGGATASFPGWKRSTTQFHARLADDSAWTNVAANAFESNANTGGFSIGTTSGQYQFWTGAAYGSGISAPSAGVVKITNGSTGEGALLSKRNVSAKTSGYTVTVGEPDTFFTNTGAGAGVTFTLPAPVAGLTYEFYRDANQTVTVDIGAGVTIRVGASATTDGGNVTLDAVGTRIRIVAISTTQWVGDSTGTLTFN